MKTLSIHRHYDDMSALAVTIITAILLFAVPERSSAQWVQSDKTGPLSGLNVDAIAVSGTNIFAGTQESGVFRSTNAGVSWSDANNGLSSSYISMLTTAGPYVFAATFGSGLFQSSDNGASWTHADAGLTSASSAECLISKGSDLFVGTHFGGVFKSSDNGSTWTAVNSGLSSMTVLSLAVIGSDLFAGVKDTGVFRSTDNGASWTAASQGLPTFDLFAVKSLAVIGTTLFAGAGAYSGPGGFFVSTDRGSSWQEAIGSLAPSTTFPTTLVVGNALFAGTDAGVYYTTDEGTTWVAFQTGFTGNAKYVDAFGISGSTMFVGTEGVGVWMRSIPSFAEVSNIHEPTHLDIFPNPARSRMTISIAMAKQALVTISILNALGQKVADLYSGKLEQGSQTIAWDSGNLPSGLYECVIASENTIEVIPVAVVH